MVTITILPASAKCLANSVLRKHQNFRSILYGIDGYVDPGITVNFIKDGKQVEKRQLKLPTRIKNVIHCKNPRCITSVEQELPQIFTLTDPATRTYRCLYCEAKAENV